MNLYRGDSLPTGIIGQSGRVARGRTFARHFCGAGLMARFGDGGRSDMVSGKSLLDLVLAHVGYDNGFPEAGLAYHSPLISFSENLHTAFHFSDRTKKKRFRVCGLEVATHFVWNLDVSSAADVCHGCYRLEYVADPINCEAIVQRQFEAQNFISAVANAAAMAHAAADPSTHEALLINVREFVGSQDTCRHDQRLVANTKERSERDKEWLLYPHDAMADGHGISARFAMNRHLHVHGCYREEPPD